MTLRDKTAKEAARDILTKYKVYNITVETLIYIIENKGYELIEFSRHSNSPAVDGLIKELEMTEYVKNARAFTYCDGMNKLVFVDEDLNADEKKCVLAHELGHIACGHLNSGGMSSVGEEYEANEFTHYLLHSRLLHKIKVRAYENRKAAAIVAAAALVLSVGACTAVIVRNNRVYYGDYYVSEHGEKYHKKSCLYIEGKDNLHRLTNEEYNSGKYEPCEACLPDEQ